MKVVLLAGGEGTRLSEETEYRPKPMVEIGGMPILWHIMKEYSYYGFNDFIVCAGYKQEFIKKWFRDYFLFTSNITFDFTDGNRVIVHDQTTEPWKVTVVDTGVDTMTGGRIGRIRDFVGDTAFMVTYGDGVCDVDISELVKYHNSHGKLATLTSVEQDQTKGVLDVDGDYSVRAFREKSASETITINAGYMVFEPDVFDYIKGDSTVLETHVLKKLAEEGELMSFSHKGYWQCMDNLHEKNKLDKLLKENRAPWKRWE